MGETGAFDVKPMKDGGYLSPRLSSHYIANLLKVRECMRDDSCPRTQGRYAILQAWGRAIDRCQGDLLDVEDGTDVGFLDRHERQL
jgi:hypothetical protein